MKTGIITLVALLGAATLPAADQSPAAARIGTHAYCYQKIVCGPVGGCQWIWICQN